MSFYSFIVVDGIFCLTCSAGRRRVEQQRGVARQETATRKLRRLLPVRLSVRLKPGLQLQSAGGLRRGRREEMLRL